MSALADQQTIISHPIAIESTPQDRTLLFSDTIDYNKPREIFKATGNVEVLRGNRTLFADELLYDRRQDKITAYGHVKLIDEKDNITFADYFELTGDLKEGVAETVRGIMTDDAVFAANKVTRQDGVRNTFYEVVYTPCSICRNTSSPPPTWNLESKSMEWNEQTGDVTHHHAYLKMFGLPVLYTPYFSHPGPTVKRRSGFLAPFFGGSGNLGTIVGLPYYWVIAEDKDLTITPVYTRENPVIMVKYRQKFCRGFWQIDGSFTESTYRKGPKDKERRVKKIRGHVNTYAQINLTRTWRAGAHINRVLDDTYLKKYTFLGQPTDSFLTSRLYGERFWQRHYALIETISFQSLTQQDTTSQIPFIAPSAHLHLLSKPTSFKGNFFFNGNVLNLERRKGRSIKRITSEGGWKTSWISPVGTVTSLRLSGRGDFYDIRNFAFSGADKFSGTRGRFIPQADLQVKYPFLKSSAQGRFLLEPTSSVVLIPNNRNSSKIPNEDSSIFELSDVNLFSPNRFAGLDKIDEWSRFNYGLKSAYYSKKIGHSELFLGQSYALVTVPESFHSTGIRKGASDYVMRLSFNYTDWISLENRSLFDKKKLRTRRNDSSLSVGQPVLRFSTIYTRAPKVTEPGISVEQVRYELSSKVTERWSLAGNINRQLGKKGGNLSHGGGITYEDDCFKCSTTITKTFYQDRDVKPAVTFMVYFSFKNLGDIEIKSDQVKRDKGPATADL